MTKAGHTLPQNQKDQKKLQENKACFRSIMKLFSTPVLWRLQDFS